MPILVKTDDVRGGKNAKAGHGRSQVVTAGTGVKELSTCTVPLESNLTLDPGHSNFETRSSMLEMFGDRVSSLKDRVPRIEKQGFLEYAKTRKSSEETIYFSKEE